MSSLSHHSRGCTRYECVCCEVQGRQYFFMVHRSEMSHRGGIQCPRCGSRGVMRSKAGGKKQQEIGEMGQPIRAARKRKQSGHSHE